MPNVSTLTAWQGDSWDVKADWAYWVSGKKGKFLSRELSVREPFNRTPIMMKTSASVILCFILCVFKKNCIFRSFTWQLCAFFWFQYWKSHCPLCFQVQSVQKYLRECVVPEERQLSACVSFLTSSYLYFTSLPAVVRREVKEGEWGGKIRLALKDCNFSALELLCVWQIFAGTYPGLFWIYTCISWAAFKNIPGSSEWQMDGAPD